MWLIRIVYVLLQCTNPNWCETTTEQTDIDLFLLVHLYFWMCFYHIILCILYYVTTFSRANAAIKLKMTLLLSLLSIQRQFTQKDLKSDSLFRKFSVATNLATSPKNSFRLLCNHAVPLWPSTEHFVFTHFHFDSSAARSNSTSEHGTVPEWPSKIEEHSSVNDERT